MTENEENLSAKREIKKAQSRERVRRFQERNYDKLRTTFFCEYCQEQHTRSIYEYKNNVARYGRFICLRENGSIIGKLPKPKVETIVDGNKVCSVCKESKPVASDFNKDRSRQDGYSSKCCACNRIECTACYNRKKMFS